MSFWRIFWPNANRQNENSCKKSALMVIRFGLQRHLVLKREFGIVSDGNAYAMHGNAYACDKGRDRREKLS